MNAINLTLRIPLRILLSGLLLFLMIGNLYAQCNPNDPNYNSCETNTTAENNGLIAKHENHQAVFHAQMIKTEKGYLITGAGMAPSGPPSRVLNLSPIPGTNYNMSGNYPVFGTFGHQQAVFLGSDGKFYALGVVGTCIAKQVYNNRGFGEVKGGTLSNTPLVLPNGVTVCDVIKMHGTNKMLTLLTSSGELYITGENTKLVHNGATQINKSFSLVPMPLGVRVSDYQVANESLLILGTDGVLYRSGRNTYAGDGTPSITGVNTPTAFPVQPPVSVQGIKAIEVAADGSMLGGTDGYPTYFILDGDGTIHVLGKNTEGLTGTGAINNIEIKSWDKVGSLCPEGILTNVKSISATGFTYAMLSASAVLTDGSMRSWGSNQANLITNGGDDYSLCPVIPCGTDTINKILSVANGGHITPILVEGGKICNIGHNQDGGFGDGTTRDRDCYECITVPVLTTTNLCDEEDSCEVTPLFTYTNTCVGDSTFFTDQSTVIPDSITAWQWDFGDGIGNSTLQNPAYLYADTGTYEVTLIAYSDTSCADSIKINVIVNPLPTVVASVDTAICIGASATVNTSGADTYVWDNGLPASAGPHTVTPAATTTYTVTGTDANGCVNDSSVTITVNPLPTITAADNSVCKDNPITICGNGGTSYTWVSLDGGLINGTSNTPCIDVETDDPGATADEDRRYEVTGTDANGCVGVDTSTVTFQFICGLTVRAEGDTICEGDVAQLTSDTSFVTGTVTYSWTPTAGLSDPTAANPTVTGLTTTTTYQVIATDAIASDTATATVYVNPLPTANDQTPAAMCEDAQGSGTVAGIDLTTNEAAINGGLVTYDWFGALPPASPIATPTNVTVSDAQVFYVLVTDNVTGCIDTATVTYTVNPLPVPDAGVDQAICIGDNVAVTATSTGAAPITYTWDQNPPGTGAGPHTLSPAATTTYTVTATDNNGCVNTDAMTITVNPLPVPDAGVDQTICVGDNATITATSTGANPIGYTWDNGLPATAGPHNVSPVATTTYTVTATDNNGCVNTDAVTVTVNPLPTPNAGADQTICLNTSTTITAISGGTGPFNFVWDNGLPATNGPHTVSPAVGTTTYIVTVTDANGCVNSDSVDIMVNPIPTIVASNDTTICEGGSVNLSVTGASTYVWRNLTTGVDFSTSANPIEQPITNTCYEVTGTDGNSCQNTGQVCVAVEQAPVTNFTVNEVCNGETTFFTNLTTGASTYNWTFGDGNGSNVFEPQHMYNGEGKYYVQLTATSQAGCTSTYADTAIVKYMPVVNFDGINLTGCPPVTATFTNRSDSLDPTFIYLWEFGDGASSSSSDTILYHAYPEVGSYTVRLTVTSNGCSDFQERINYVTVYPVPEAHFIAEPSMTSIYDPTINFTDFSIGADLWFWSFGDSTTSNDQHPLHVYTDTGTFTVWLKVENIYGCTDSAAKPVKIKDVYTFFAPNSFTPNGDGVNDIFLPQGHAIDMDEYTLQIFDRWGELLFETHDYYEGWNGIYQGTLVQIDTYVWKVTLQDIYGAGHKYTGKISILR